MTPAQRRRRVLELEHAERWFRRGERRFHLENLHILRPIVSTVLHASGLMKRGKRNALKLHVTRETFRFPNLPQELQGFRILYLSDLHIDGVPGLVEAVCRELRNISSDLCIFGGDYRFATEGPAHNVYPAMKEIVSCVHSTHGMVGVLGNHDYYEELPELQRIGIRMLYNESWRLTHRGADIWIVGTDDPHYYQADDFDAAFSAVPAGAFVVLACHTPERYIEAAQAGVSLYLCGHTHAGQIRFPIVGPLILHAQCPRRFTAGRWQHGVTQGYTSAGVGCSMLPVRFNCPPEIVIVELSR
jgi:uncharacterized protein